MDYKVPRERIYAMIAAEVLAEELVKLRKEPAGMRLPVYTRAYRWKIFDEVSPLLSEADWRRMKTIIEYRIRCWDEEQRKRENPTAWKHY